MLEASGWPFVWLVSGRLSDSERGPGVCMVEAWSAASACAANFSISGLVEGATEAANPTLLWVLLRALPYRRAEADGEPHGQINSPLLSHATGAAPSVFESSPVHMTVFGRAAARARCIAARRSRSARHWVRRMTIPSWAEPPGDAANRGCEAWKRALEGSHHLAKSAGPFGSCGCSFGYADGGLCPDQSEVQGILDGSG
jgi:hypothetical protein